MHTINNELCRKIDFGLLPFNQIIKKKVQKKAGFKTMVKLVLDSLAERELVLYLSTLLGSLVLLGILSIFSV